MARYRRTFFCKLCNTSGTLEQICEGMAIVECSDCGVAEIWGMDVLDPLDHFLFIDEPVAVAVGGWMN